MKRYNILIIGDVHGEKDLYKQVLIEHGYMNSIQLGDLGDDKIHKWHWITLDNEKHKVLFGNHDHYNFLKKPYSLGDFGILHEEIMYVRGAYSSNYGRRIEGEDWFINEELNYQEWIDATKLYNQVKPKIMLSHDCPAIASKELYGYASESNTSLGLNEMFKTHKPDLWIFGHHHKSRDCVIDGTRFICLNMLATHIV